MAAAAASEQEWHVYIRWGRGGDGGGRRGFGALPWIPHAELVRAFQITLPSQIQGWRVRAGAD